MNNNNKIRCKKCNFETSEPDKYFYKKKGSKNGYQYNCIKCSREQSFIWANVEKNFMGFTIALESLPPTLRFNAFSNLLKPITHTVR